MAIGRRVEWEEFRLVRTHQHSTDASANESNAWTVRSSTSLRLRRRNRSRSNATARRNASRNVHEALPFAVAIAGCQEHSECVPILQTPIAEMRGDCFRTAQDDASVVQILPVQIARRHAAACRGLTDETLGPISRHAADCRRGRAKRCSARPCRPYPSKVNRNSLNHFTTDRKLVHCVRGRICAEVPAECRFRARPRRNTSSFRCITPTPAWSAPKPAVAWSLAVMSTRAPLRH